MPFEFERAAELGLVVQHVPVDFECAGFDDANPVARAALRLFPNDREQRMMRCK
jgi:hypothetical protein